MKCPESPSEGVDDLLSGFLPRGMVHEKTVRNVCGSAQGFEFIRDRSAVFDAAMIRLLPLVPCFHDHLRDRRSASPLPRGRCGLSVPRRGDLRVSKLATVPLAVSGLGLPVCLAGAPWWVVLATAVLAGLAIPVSSEIRAWSRLLDQRRMQRASLFAIERIAEPQEQVRALLQLHRAISGDAAVASGPDVPALEPMNAT